MQRHEGVRTTSRLLSYFTVEYHLLIRETNVSPRTKPDKPLGAVPVYPKSYLRRISHCTRCFHHPLALCSGGKFLTSSSPPGFTGLTAVAHKLHRGVA